MEKIRRELLVEEEMHVEAQAREVTYQHPADVQVTDVMAHYTRVLRQGTAVEVLFQCTGRDCGRSNQWANQVFRKAILYGPDNEQAYIAVRIGELLVSVYAIERGNRKVYSHVQVLKPRPGSAVNLQEHLVQTLAASGFVVVPDVSPREDGSLAPMDQQHLASLARALTPLNRQVLYVVCHQHGAGAVDDLLKLSSVCARNALDAMAADLPAHIEAHSYGAGPLSPRIGTPRSRIELVLPHRTPPDARRDARR